jgi:tape measure domain-containing protein
MAKIQETLVLQDRFSSSFGAYIQAAQRASSSTTTAQAAARNYQSVLNSVSRQLISANAKFESYVAQQEEMVAAGQQNTEAFKKLDTQTEKLGATIRGLEAQQQTLTQSMEAAENAASVAASAKDEAAAATKRLQEQENMAQSVTNSLTSSVLRLAASYVSIQGLKKAVDLSDSLVSMRARLDRMNDGLQTTQELETMIYQSAQRSRGSFTDTMGLVSQLGTMAGDAFSSSKEIVQFAEQLNKQLALSGASGASAQAAILQLEQGLASGVLRGDELNSVMEQAPALAKSIADHVHRPPAVKATGKHPTVKLKLTIHRKADHVSLFQFGFRGAKIGKGQFARLTGALGRPDHLRGAVRQVQGVSGGFLSGQKLIGHPSTSCRLFSGIQPSTVPPVSATQTGQGRARSMMRRTTTIWPWMLVRTSSPLPVP